MRAVLAFGIPVAALVATGVVAVVADNNAPHQAYCHATQPVYTSSTPYVLAGTWEAYLLPGQSVELPDGDTATCTQAGDVNLTGTDGPLCPTEDSCVADYRDGAWHITRVTP